MRFEEGFWRNRIEPSHALVNLNGVQCFLNFFFAADDTFTFQQGSDLIKIERVSFNSQASLNSADAVGLPEVWLGFWLIETFDSPDEPFDPTYRLKDLSGDAEGRIHGVIVSCDIIRSRHLIRRGTNQCCQTLQNSNLGYFKMGVESTARASFYFYNTKAEVDRLIEVMAQTQRFFNG